MDSTNRFTIRVNDLLPELSATLEDSNGAVNLSGCTVSLVLMDQGVKTEYAATIVNAASGQVKYTWVTGDTASAGEFEAYWLVTYGDGRTSSFPNDDAFLVAVIERAQTVSSTTFGWVGVTEATNYLASAIGAEDFTNLQWDTQGRYFVTAYRMLVNDPEYTFPSTASQKMKDAQCELALYLYRNPTYGDRSILISQGVSRFKIGQFEEEYNGAFLAAGLSKYPPIVSNLVDEYKTDSSAVGLWTRTD